MPLRYANPTAPIRVPGTGHSFTPVNFTDGTLIDLSAFDGLKGVDAARQTATAGAATPLWRLGPSLHAKGFGLKNMGDIDRQTLAGVVNTGTHGTGRTLKNFSAEVAGFRLVLASGEVVNCSAGENADIFAAGRTSLGSFGVMTEITMNVRPAYKLVERNFFLPIRELFEQLDALVADNRHFEFFWFPYADVAICKSLNETDEPAPAPRTAEQMYERGERPTSDQSAFGWINEILPYAPFLLGPAHRLFSRLMPGPAKVRWSHEIFPSPRTTRFNEMEYALPFDKGPQALKEVVDTIRRSRINTGFPIEYRTVAADDVWLSPFSGAKAPQSPCTSITASIRGGCSMPARRCSVVTRAGRIGASAIPAPPASSPGSIRASRSSARCGAGSTRKASSSIPIFALCSPERPEGR